MSYTITMSIPASIREAKASCRTPADAVRIAGDIGHLPKETFAIICLNTRHKVIDKHLISIGVVDQTIVRPAEIFRPAIADGASAIILLHNHPSGDPTPSAEDIAVTNRLIKAGGFIDMQILDHIVVTAKEDGTFPFFSMRDMGTMSFEVAR